METGAADKKLRRRCALTKLRRTDLLTTAALGLALVVGLTGCGKKEEGQKSPSTTKIQRETSRTKSGEITERAALRQEDQPSLAVIDFQNRTGDPTLNWLSMGIAELLITDLAQSPHLRVLSGQRLFNILQEMDKENLFSIDAITAAEVAQRAGAGSMVVGSIGKMGNKWLMEAQLLDVATGDVIKAERVEEQGLESIFTMVDRLARAIKEGLNIPPAEAGQDRDIVNLTTSSLEAYQAFIKGLEKFYGFQLGQAVAFMEQAVKIDSNFVLASAVTAIYFNSVGDVTRTREATEKAMALVDRLPDSERLMTLALDAQIRGDYEESTRLYQRLLGSVPEENNPIVYLGWGQLHFAKGQLETSKRFYKSFLQLNPTMGAGHFMLGLVYIQQGMVDSTERELQEALRLSPDIAAAHLLLARIYSAQGRRDEVESCARRALEVDPKNPLIHNLMGYHYLNHGQHDPALAEFKQYVALAPNDPNSHDSLAEAYFRKGDFGRAEQEYLQAIELDPNFANPYYMLALIYEQQGQTSKTIKQLKEFIRLGPEDRRTKGARQKLESLQQK